MGPFDAVAAALLLRIGRPSLGELMGDFERLQPGVEGLHCVRLRHFAGG